MAPCFVFPALPFRQEVPKAWAVGEPGAVAQAVAWAPAREAMDEPSVRRAQPRGPQGGPEGQDASLAGEPPAL